MKITKTFISLGIAAVLAVLAGCRNSDTISDEGLTARLPADAPILACVNLVEVMENAGCKAEGNRLTLTDEAAAVINWGDSNTPLLKNLVGSDVLDISHVYAVGDSNFDIILLTEAVNPEGFEKILADNGFTSTKKGKHLVWIHPDDPISFIEEGNIVTITTDSGTADELIRTVEKMLKPSDEKSVADVEWINTQLSRDNTVNLLIDGNIVPGITVSGRISARFNLKGPEVSARIMTLDETGQPTDGFTTLTKYITLAMTAGLRPLLPASAVVTDDSEVKIDLAPGSETLTAFGIFFGIEYRQWSEKECTNFTLKLTGTDEPVLEALMGLAF